MMTGAEAIEYIDSYYQHVTTPGLSRIREIMERLGNPQKKLKYIHVAGTNGKGSTCAMVERILREAGYRTGLFTSPHLIRFHERMQVCGVQISDEDLAAVTEEVKPVAESMSEAMNEFELIMAIGFVWFARQNCDIVVMEVGLGGEFDATNVIDCPEVAVICNIGLDHTAILGNTLAEVASAKAGIIKPGCQVAAYRGVEEVEAVFEKRCSELGAVLHKADFDAINAISSSLEGQVFDFGPYKALQLGLIGSHQLNNAAVALTTIEILQQAGWQIGEDAIRCGLQSVVWPVRFQVMERDPLFVLDGGHNPQCVESLADNLRRLLPDTYLVLLMGVLGDKDARTMTDELSELAGEFVAMTPQSYRALPAEELAGLLQHFGKEVTVCGDVAGGIEEAMRRAKAHNGAVCCVGSLYLAGEVLEYFEKRGKDA